MQLMLSSSMGFSSSILVPTYDHLCSSAVAESSNTLATIIKPASLRM
jgi:hypothetical protein